MARYSWIKKPRMRSNWLASITFYYDKVERRLKQKQRVLANRHCHQCAQLKQAYESKHKRETQTRSLRLPTGLKALWFLIAGAADESVQQTVTMELRQTEPDV